MPSRLRDVRNQSAHDTSPACLELVAADVIGWIANLTPRADYFPDKVSAILGCDGLVFAGGRWRRRSMTAR